MTIRLEVAMYSRSPSPAGGNQDAMIASRQYWLTDETNQAYLDVNIGDERVFVGVADGGGGQRW